MNNADRLWQEIKHRGGQGDLVRLVQERLGWDNRTLMLAADECKRRGLHVAALNDSDGGELKIICLEVTFADR